MRLAIRLTAALASILLLGPTVWSEDDEEPKILGRTTPEALREAPYADWFVEGYEQYEPNPAILEQLRAVDQESTELTVFFGTWCHDSQREVPRLVKLLDEMGFPRGKLTLVAVNDDAETHKQSPGGEEKGLEVYRVPTVVVRRDGAEVARLVEHPVLSQERDLLAILSGEPYQLSSPSCIQPWITG